LIRQVTGGSIRLAPSPVLAIPASTRGLADARLDRLTDAKGVAQLGAVIGRHFSYELLAAVSKTTASVNPQALDRNLARLVDAGLLFVDHESARRELHL
jgi:predicted ATPase